MQIAGLIYLLRILFDPWDPGLLAKVFAMQDFDTTMETETSDTQERLRDRLWAFLTYVLKRVVLVISFGPGILGLLWLFGRIFKRR